MPKIPDEPITAAKAHLKAAQDELAAGVEQYAIASALCGLLATSIASAELQRQLYGPSIELAMQAAHPMRSVDAQRHPHRAAADASTGLAAVVRDYSFDGEQ